MTAPRGPPPARGLPSAGASEKVLWLLGRRRRFRVEGPSMEPHLREGDEILVDPHAFRRRPPVPGEVVVARHPFRSSVRIVKRVAAVLPGGALDLRGDNPAATTDAATLGPLPPSLLLGRVTARL